MTAGLGNSGKKYFLTSLRIFDIIYIVKERGDYIYGKEVLGSGS